MRLINMEEIWKDIPQYEGIYQVSNYGNVRSLNYKKTNTIKLFKPSTNNYGYYQIVLTKNKKPKTFKVHQLVAITFLNHVPNGHNIVVNHIDNNSLNNHVDNLELVSQRYNSSCHKINCGIYWNKNNNKWCSTIKINQKDIYLGSFLNKEEGLQMYELAFNNLHLYNGNKKEFRLKLKTLLQ